MALISSCPACSRNVTVPAAHPESKVRCPLCQAEFKLQSALDLAPPMLEILESPIGAALDYSEMAKNGVPVQASAAMAATGTGFDEEGPSFSEELGFDAPPLEDAELDSEEPDTELEGKTPSFDELTGEEELETGELDLTEMPDEESPFGLGGPMTVEAETETAPEEFGDDTAIPGMSAASSAVNRRKREPSFIGNLIGVVGGGVVGCGLAYFIVLWIGGPDKDFLELGPKLPKWILPSSFSRPATATATPMSKKPTPSDIKDMKQAAGVDDNTLKLNVPELSDQPGNQAAPPKLPFAPDSADAAPGDGLDSTEDLATDLANEDPLVGSPTAAAPKASDSADAAPEEMPEEATDEPKAGDTEDTASFDEPTEETPDATAPAATSELGPKEPPIYTAADLDTVSGEVANLATQLAGAKDLEPAAAKKIKGQYYRKVYRLGDIVTFATDADAGKQAVEMMLQELAADKTKFSEIGRAGALFLTLDPVKRGKDKGVLLAGTVEEVGTSGDMHRVRLLPAGHDQPISIYSATAPAMKVSDTVLVLGSIITDPKESLHNFTDDEPTVIWHGLSVKADE